MADSDTLKISNLSKNFGNLAAVNNVSFTAEKGQIIALLGPNGAGKSTLMNMVSGYLMPTSGEIFVLGKNINLNPIESKSHIGFLPEGAPMYPDLSVKRFLSYMAELNGVAGKNVMQEVLRVAETAKILNVLNQKIETLSKGYQRRVGFAQSILNNPEILLLDEPTDGLDPNQKVHMRQLITQMGKNKIILISTHLLDEAETICNRIILINKGQIMADGSLKDILKSSHSRHLENAFKKLTTLEEED